MFKSHSKAVAIVLALVLTISMCSMSATAANEATPTDTQTITVHQGDVIKYSVYMTVPERFVGVQFAIDYGSNLELSSEFQSASASDLVKMFMPTFTNGINLANPNPGVPNQIWGSNVHAAGGYEFKNGELLATVTLVAKKSGTAKITASVSEIYKDNDNFDSLMSVTTLNGEAEVVSSAEHTLGDVNGDGNITVADAIEVQRHIANIVILEGEQLTAADTNADCNITVADAIEIQRVIAGLTTFA